MTAPTFSALTQACEALLEARRYEQALSLAHDAVVASPQDARALMLEARALQAAGRLPEAMEACRQAVTVSPSWSYPHRLLSISARQLAKSVKVPWERQQLLAVAVQESSQAVRLGPAEYVNHLALAEAAADSSQLARADEAVRQALKLAPQRATCWVTASYVAIDTRNWAAAESAARTALVLEPNNSAASNNLGVALRRQGKWAHGAVAFADAARLDPRSDKARDNMEILGFSYMARVVSLLFLPLLVYPPLFVIARARLAAWFVHDRPMRLRALATRIGARVAASKGHRRRYEKSASSARDLAAARALDGPGDWSAMGGGRAYGVWLRLALMVVATYAVVIAVLLLLHVPLPSELGFVLGMGVVVFAMGAFAGRRRAPRA